MKLFRVTVTTFANTPEELDSTVVLASTPAIARAMAVEAVRTRLALPATMSLVGRVAS